MRTRRKALSFMSEPRQFRLYLRSESQDGDWHNHPATPKQMARLRYLGMAPGGAITKGQAGILIDRSETDPSIQEKVQAWHEEKYRLHPDLYFPEPRTRDDARNWQRKFGPSRIYGLAFRKPTQKQILAILELLDHQVPGWEHAEVKRHEYRFMNELAVSFPSLRTSDCFIPCDAASTPTRPATGGVLHAVSTLQQRPHPLSSPRLAQKRTSARSQFLIPVGAFVALVIIGVCFKGQSSREPSAPDAMHPAPVAAVAPTATLRARNPSTALTPSPAPIVAATAFSMQPPPTRPALPTLSAVELAARVAQAKRQAVARYPDLETAGSEINSRFGFRYKLLLADHSPRLQDPTWPLQLADECAAASGMKVQRSTTVATPTQH